MSEKKPYTPPTVTTLGTIQALTEVQNKIGSSGDQFSGQTGLSGSIVTR